MASATHFTTTANASRVRIEAPSATNHLAGDREAHEVPGERHLQGDMAEARLAGMVAHIGAFYGGAYRPEGDVRTQAEPIARACAAARKSLMDVLRRQRPLEERVPDVEDVVELMRPFRNEKTWFVWGAKFLHFLRPDVFPIIDRRIERALGHGQRISNSPGYLVAFCRLVRDVMLESGALLVVVNFFGVRPDALARIFPDPGDHGGDMETSLVLHLRPDLVVMAQAGDGGRVPWTIPSLAQEGVWTPRPWSQTHPDTGAGDPAAATAAKGAEYFAAVTDAISGVIVDVARATRGDVPFV